MTKNGNMTADEISMLYSNSHRPSQSSAVPPPEEEIIIPSAMRASGEQQYMTSTETNITNHSSKTKCENMCISYDLLRYKGSLELEETTVCQLFFLLK